METLYPPSLATYSIKPQISFSLYLCGLNKTLYIENYHMRTNGHRPKGKVNLSNFIFHGRHGGHGLFSVFSVCSVVYFLFSTEDTEVTDYFQCFLCAPWFNFTQLSEVVLNHRV